MKEEGKLLGVKEREMEGVDRKVNVKVKSEPYLILYTYENIKIKFIICMLIVLKMRWREGSMVKSTYISCRGSESDFQHPSQVAHNHL